LSEELTTIVGKEQEWSSTGGTRMSMAEGTRKKLAAVSTATLTTVLFKRGFRNTFIQGIHRINPAAPAMVGPAYTMRYIPAREDLDHLGVFEDRSHPQRKGIEECPPGHVFVIDSRRNPAAASAGGILVTRLWKRGAAGIVTDGGLRDTPEIATLPFPAYHAAASAPTNLIRHHAVDLNVPIACGEVAVYPGDILVGDGEGVAVIPQHIADAVAEEAFEQTAYEDFVQEQVEAGRSIFGIYPPAPEAREEFKRWRTAKGR
jgi:regulator of RNase E activity RraA